MQRWVTLGATVGKWCGRHLRSQQLLLLQKRVGGLRELETPGSVPAINRIIAKVSAAPVQMTVSAAQSADQKWREWQNLASAVGLDFVYLPAVLSPASKAILIQLHAAAVSQPPAIVGLQVRRASAFADACAHLPTPAASALPTEERGWPDGRDGQLQGGSREEGEGHGPRKEFFALVGAGMTTTRTGLREEALFIYNESAACYWTDLGIRLAPLLWQKVLQGGSFQASFENVQSFDPAAAQALQKRVCVEDVQWQSASFAQGFCAAVSLDVLQAYIVRPQDLTAMVSGSSTSWQAITGIQDVFHIVLDHQLQTEFQDLVTCLWEVVNAWETELKQHFLFFLTGSRRLPQPHTEVLRIELPFVAFDLKDHTIMLSRLPQAHTCENILELPNYQESLLAVHVKEAGRHHLLHVMPLRLFNTL
ncbi:hypothetical protein WJX79_000246 [Trebouxia sp. C0005]